MRPLELRTTEQKQKDLADRVGEIDELMERLEAERNMIKSRLSREGVIEAKGKYYTVSLFTVHRDNIRWKQLALSMKPSRQRIQAYKTKQIFTQMKARRNENES